MTDETKNVEEIVAEVPVSSTKTGVENKHGDNNKAATIEIVPIGPTTRTLTMAELGMPEPLPSTTLIRNLFVHCKN